MQGFDIGFDLIETCRYGLLWDEQHPADTERGSRRTLVHQDERDKAWLRERSPNGCCVLIIIDGNLCKRHAETWLQEGIRPSCLQVLDGHFSRRIDSGKPA